MFLREPDKGVKYRYLFTTISQKPSNDNVLGSLQYLLQWQQDILMLTLLLGSDMYPIW